MPGMIFGIVGLPGVHPPNPAALCLHPISGAPMLAEHASAVAETIDEWLVGGNFGTLVEVVNYTAAEEQVGSNSFFLVRTYQELKGSTERHCERFGCEASLLSQASFPACHWAASQEEPGCALHSGRVARVSALTPRGLKHMPCAGPAARQTGGDDVYLPRQRHCELTRLREGGEPCTAAAWPCSCAWCHMLPPAPLCTAVSQAC